jgi:integrase
MWSSYLLDINIQHGDFSPFQNQVNSKFDPKGIPFVIPNITPHWLRHTYATMLYFAGVDILTAKDQLGHADIKTTLNIYTHLDQQYKRKSMEKLNVFLNDASQMQVTDTK